MPTPPELPQPGTLGWRLRRARADRSLKSVADEAQITAAYLQKLERNNVQKPSPNVLHALGGEEVVPTVVELRAGGRLSEFSQTVEAATSGVAVAMVV